MKGIADTGFLVAFVNRADEHHDWAVSIAEQVTEPVELEQPGQQGPRLLSSRDLFLVTCF